MTVIEKHLHKMPYDKAVKAAEVLASAADATEAQKAEYAAALSSHPGNGRSHSTSTTETGSESDGEPNGTREKVGRVWEEKLGGSGLTPSQVIDKLVAGAIDAAEAKRLNAMGQDGVTVFCSAKSGWICINGKGRYPANLHPELAERICNDQIKAILAKHHDETAGALAAAKK